MVKLVALVYGRSVTNARVGGKLGTVPCSSSDKRDDERGWSLLRITKYVTWGRQNQNRLGKLNRQAERQSKEWNARNAQVDEAKLLTK